MNGWKVENLREVDCRNVKFIKNSKKLLDTTNLKLQTSAEFLKSFQLLNSIEIGIRVIKTLCFNKLSDKLSPRWFSVSTNQSFSIIECKRGFIHLTHFVSCMQSPSFFLSSTKIKTDSSHLLNGSNWAWFFVIDNRKYKSKYLWLIWAVMSFALQVSIDVFFCLGHYIK